MTHARSSIQAWAHMHSTIYPHDREYEKGYDVRSQRQGKRQRGTGDQAYYARPRSQPMEGEEDFSIGALHGSASSHSIFAFADRLARVQEQQQEQQQASKQAMGNSGGREGKKDAVCMCVSGYWRKSSGDVQAHESLGPPAG